MMDDRTLELVNECQRQTESCLYTSAALHEWQKRARLWRSVFIVSPIVLGGLASSQILIESKDEYLKLLTSFCGLLAGFFPTIFIALNMDMGLAQIGRSATEFTNLRDRFRQAANVKAHAPFEEFKTEFEVLMDRMDQARLAAPPSPEWCFKKAQRKINKGDHNFKVDARVNP